MYLFFGLLILFFFLFFCINFRRRKKIIRKVCCMCPEEKYEILNDLIEPFGYRYLPSQDIFTSRIDAWQRDFGYHAFFNRAASYFGMIIDCLPVCFNYRGRTWMIEFWKGQYGINTGCEIGVYYADRILEEKERDHTLFQCVDDEDMLKLSLSLFDKKGCIAQLCDRHWWLTAFDPGCFNQPSDLTLQASVTLHSHEMAAAFAQELKKAGCPVCDLCVCHKTVSFTFTGCACRCGWFCRIKARIVQGFNRLWCGIYRFVTRPFTLSADRILYLYYYLPAAFRRILPGKRRRKRSRKTHGKDC